MKRKSGIDVLTVDTYAEFVAIDDDSIILVNANHLDGKPRWQITVPREYAADLIAELAHGLEGEPS